MVWPSIWMGTIMPGRLELARTWVIMSVMVGMSSLVNTRVRPVSPSKDWMAMRAGLAQKASQSKGMKPSSTQPV